jgi:hypothetical protein
MFSQFNKRFVLPALIVAFGLSSTVAAYDELIDRQAGIRVSVLPVSLTRGHQARFKVWITTHSGELNQNMLKISLLLDDQDREYSPIRWKGSQPGGRYYHGDLFFPPLDDNVKWVKLLIKGVGGVENRDFTWKLDR